MLISASTRHHTNTTIATSVFLKSDKTCLNQKNIINYFILEIQHMPFLVFKLTVCFVILKIPQRRYSHNSMMIKHLILKHTRTMIQNNFSGKQQYDQMQRLIDSKSATVLSPHEMLRNQRFRLFTITALFGNL